MKAVTELYFAPKTSHFANIVKKDHELYATKLLDCGKQVVEEFDMQSFFLQRLGGHMPLFFWFIFYMVFRTNMDWIMDIFARN
jgi:hypothetical protein